MASRPCREWAVSAGTSARRRPIFFANGVLRRASISSSISFPAASSGVLRKRDVAVFIVSPIPAMVRSDFRCRRTRSVTLFISRSRSRFSAWRAMSVRRCSLSHSGLRRNSRAILSFHSIADIFKTVQLRVKSAEGLPRQAGAARNYRTRSHYSAGSLKTHGSATMASSSCRRMLSSGTKRP